MIDVYPGVEERAQKSLGTSDSAIYAMVARVVKGHYPGGGTIVDVGCGPGNLWPFIHEHFTRYVGVDVLPYEGFPSDAEFTQVDLDTGRASLPDNSADVVAAVETIEHLENPRAFMRELLCASWCGW